jgi:demethylmenaquinone methyltransferase/2-methoxy-6-polyprenyl-1,4-benzoquinol methylase
MSSAYYQSGEARAPRVRALFDRIARRYDLINDVQSVGLHRLWKRRLIRLAEVRPGDRALDLCCGTGDVTFALARAGAKATGVDFTQAMLDVAVSRSAREGVGAVEFLQGDALQLPFADGCFEVVTISYGLRNLADFERGLREIHRVLVPGGRLVVLDFGKPSFSLWRWVYFAYLRICVPVYGRIFAGDWAAYAYILESLERYPAQQGVDDLLRRIGFRETRVEDLMGGVMGINWARK